MRDPLYPDRRQRPRWVVPLVVAVGVVVAVSIGAVVALALGGSRDAASGDASPTPTASAAVSPSLDPTPDMSVAQSPSPEPTPVAVPIIPNLAIATITVDALPMWSEPNESSIKFGELGLGGRLFIIGDPTDVGGTRWYRVAYVDGPKVSGFDLGECQLNCGPSLGFISTPATGEDASLEEAEVACPTSPMITDQLVQLMPLERLHCYGGSDITVTGTLDNFTFEPIENGANTPAWLADMPPRSIGDGSMGVHFAPELDGELPAPAATVRMVGHFEDEAAPTCRVDYTRVADAPSTAHYVLGCRSAFVVTEFEVLGGQ